MSYSFVVTGADKAAAKAAVAAELDKVIAGQPMHARDKEAAIANAGAVIDLLTDSPPEGSIVHVSMNGSVGWMGDYQSKVEEAELTAASVSAYARWGSE